MAKAKVLAFEEIRVGQSARLEKKVTAELLDSFSRISGDANPLHMSEAFAASKGFEGRVAHGLLIGSFFSAIAGMLLPGRDCVLQETRFSFRKPVVSGSSLICEAVVVQKVDAVRTIVLDLSVTDSSGNVVLTGRMQAGVRS